MSRQIDEEEPLSQEDREYLEARGNYALIRRMDERHGTSAEPEAETEESLAAAIAEAEGNLAAMRARHTSLVLAREQEEARVKDNTVVDGQGGSEDRADGYEDWSKAKLSAEIEKRNEEREDDDQISSSGTKAQLVERLRAMDAEDDDEDEDEE